MNTEEMDSIWTNLQKSDTLESLGEMIAALQERMDKKKKENIVKEKFGEFQTVERKKGNKTVTFFRAYYYEDGKRKQKEALTEDCLVEKLWEMLEKNHVNQNATIEEVFEQYKVSRKQICENGSIESQTRDYDTSNWKRFFEGTDFSKMPIREVKALHIRREYERICGDHKFTQKAFSKAKCLLNGIFDEAVLMGIADVNLARSVPTKGLKFKLKEVKDGEEAEQEVYTLYEAGASERDIQYAAGHSSVNTTRHYDRSKTSGPSLDMVEKAIG